MIDVRTPGAARAAPSVRRPWRMPLLMALTLAFVSLALIDIVAYVAVLSGATGTTEKLLVDRTASVVEEQIQVVRSRLDPVTQHLELIAALMASGRIDIESPVAVHEALWAMMKQVPVVTAAAFGTLDHRLFRVVRRLDGSVLRDDISLLDQPQGWERLRELQTSHRTFWGALFWGSTINQLLLNVRTPVRRVDDAFIGGLIATVSVSGLSYLISNQTPGGDNRFFILVDHDKVLAHRRLIDPRGLGLSEARPLPTVDQVDDPVLAHIWDPPVRSAQIDNALGNLGHVVSIDGRRWVFVYQQLTSYGPDPWIVGRYFPIEEAIGDLDRLINGALVGAVTLAVAILLALVLGLRMVRSIRTLTSAAEAIERLEFDKPFHKPSWLREIDEAGHSLDKARNTLKWFGAYVPRSLVRRLMEAGAEEVPSRRRTVTVMFTDIVEFTPQAESLPVQETAALLNHHFALLGACIEREQGMIDKYIGDSVMAVWGILQHPDDHAAAALRAALAIVAVMREDNAVRRTEGRDIIRLRIGVHSGPVVVGNIGAPGRVNFTVVGDTVNIAQRFEQLGKEFMGPDDECVLLTSGETISLVDRAALGIDVARPELRHVKGRDKPVEVYRLA
jgi:class 3 adenylate cyclase